MIKQISVVAVAAATLAAFSFGATAHAGTATQTDKAFVGKVSQGGMYEVIASQYAQGKASAPDVKDLADTEVHDHTGVGDRLKAICAADGISVSSSLNAMFSARLKKLEAVPAGQFDAAYIVDMKSIHDKDQKLFAREAVDGSADFRTFAHETDLIVKRHIGALHG